MNNFYKLKNFLIHKTLAIFLSLCMSMNPSEYSDNQKKQIEISNLIIRCRKRIKDFPHLNDPLGCLTLEEETQLSYDDKRKLSDEAQSACLYNADLR